MRLEFRFQVITLIIIIIIIVHWMQNKSIIHSSFDVLKSNAKLNSSMNIFRRLMTFKIILSRYKYPRRLVIT